MTQFKPNKSFVLKHIQNYEQFKTAVHQHFVSKNIMYAIKVTASFTKITARSEYPQPKPYQSIDVSLSKTQQKIFLKNTTGTLVGFFVPDVFQKIILPDFHFHYINDTRTTGGHVFDFSFDRATVSIQSCRHIHIVLPNTSFYDKMDLTPDVEHATSIAERG